MVSARDTWLIQLRARRAAAKVITLFAEHGIDVLPVKGIVTAHTLYADVAERILTDVDLRIRPEDFRKALRVIRGAGFRILQLMYTYGNVVFSVDGVSIDVETHPSAPGLCALTVDTMIKRATPSDLFGVPHLMPDFHDHAVVLMLNVFKDKFVHAFKWAVRDLEVLPTSVHFEVPTLVDRLLAAKAVSMGAVVAGWMLEERGCDGWAAPHAELVARAPRLRYVGALRWLVRHVAHDATVVRLLSRAGSDSLNLRAQALVLAGAWTAEALGSRFRRRGFVRQVLPDDVLVSPRPSPPPQRPS